jgi:hypothetical protein
VAGHCGPRHPPIAPNPISRDPRSQSQSRIHFDALSPSPPLLARGGPCVGAAASRTSGGLCYPRHPADAPGASGLPPPAPPPSAGIGSKGPPALVRTLSLPRAAKIYSRCRGIIGLRPPRRWRDRARKPASRRPLSKPSLVARPRSFLPFRTGTRPPFSNGGVRDAWRPNAAITSAGGVAVLPSPSCGPDRSTLASTPWRVWVKGQERKIGLRLRYGGPRRATAASSSVGGRSLPRRAGGEEKRQENALQGRRRTPAEGCRVPEPLVPSRPLGSGRAEISGQELSGDEILARGEQGRESRTGDGEPLPPSSAQGGTKRRSRPRRRGVAGRRAAGHVSRRGCGARKGGQQGRGRREGTQNLPSLRAGGWCFQRCSVGNSLSY